jgi:hypothetical protein
MPLFSPMELRCIDAFLQGFNCPFPNGGHGNRPLVCRIGNGPSSELINPWTALDKHLGAWASPGVIVADLAFSSVSVSYDSRSVAFL